MRVRFGFGLRFGLLVERRELGEEAVWRGFWCTDQIEGDRGSY